MTLASVSLTLDLYDGQGSPVTQGVAYLTPSAQLTAPLVTEAPAPVSFEGPGLPQVSLLATDNASLAPAGWGWEISFAWVPGNPGPWTFFLPAGPVSFTATDASPAVFTFTPTAALAALPDSTGVQLAGGSLPGGFSSGATYYVVNASGSTFKLAATVNGFPLASTSSGSGSATAVSGFLSSLTPVSDVTTMAACMPLPAGTPAPGAVPVATGHGAASAWSTGVLMDETGGLLS